MVIASSELLTLYSSVEILTNDASADYVVNALFVIISMIFPAVCHQILHCVPKKRSHFYFFNNSVKNEPMLIIFGTLNPEGT